MSQFKDLFGHDKVEEAIERIKTFEPPEGYYLAFSGGKDSQCIYHLAEMARVKFDAHYNITGIDPPELVRFIRKQYPNVKRHLPKITIWQLIKKKHMPPTRMKRYCCEFLKEANGERRRVLTGVRWAESLKRRKRKLVEQCFKDKSKTYVNPIIDWVDNDVWEFLKPYPHCSLYDEGFKRLGCVGCPNSNIKKEFERWPKIADQWKRSIYAAWSKRSEDQKGFNTQKEMWDWYVSGKYFSRNPDQTVMFE